MKIEDNDYKGFDDGGSWVPALVIGFFCCSYSVSTCSGWCLPRPCEQLEDPLAQSEKRDYRVTKEPLKGEPTPTTLEGTKE